MTPVQEPLWREGWETEPCGDAEPVQQPRSPWRRHMGPMSDCGRSAARSDVAAGRRIHTINVKGGLL